MNEILISIFSLFFLFNIRRAFTLVPSFFKEKVKITDSIRETYYCSIGDGGFRYMIAQKYLNFINPTIYSLFIRSNNIDLVFKERYLFVYSDLYFEYKKPISYGKFAIECTLLAKDDRHLYVKLNYIQKGEVCSVGLTKLIVLKQGVVPIASICQFNEVKNLSEINKDDLSLINRLS